MSFSLTPLTEKYKGELYEQFNGAKGLAEIVRQHIKDNKNGIFKDCRFNVRIGNTKWGRYHCLDVYLHKAPFNPFQGETKPYCIPDLSPQMAAIRDSLMTLVSKYWRNNSDIMSDYHDTNFYAELYINFDRDSKRWEDDIKDE